MGNGFIDFRKVWGILSLGKSAPREAVEDACRQAIETGSISYQAVRAFLGGGNALTNEHKQRRSCWTY